MSSWVIVSTSGNLYLTFEKPNRGHYERFIISNLVAAIQSHPEESNAQREYSIEFCSVFRAVVPKVSKARTINVIIFYLIASSPEESP